MTTTQLQLRRDTAANIAGVTPAQGEPIYDVTNNRLVMGDGTTPGGRPYPGVDGSDNLVLPAGETFPTVSPINGAVLTDTTQASYAEGTWAPTLIGSTTAGSPTYTTQVGSWTRIGRVVMCQFKVAVSALGGMAGNLEIGGLPFASANVSSDQGNGVVGAMTGVALDSGYTFASLLVLPNESFITFEENGSGKANQPLPVSDLTAPVTISGTVAYHV